MNQPNTIIKKTKTSVYISENDEKLLNEVFIKRLRNRTKTDRSTLLCEGIPDYVYEKEFETNSQEDAEQPYKQSSS